MTDQITDNDIREYLTDGDPEHRVRIRRDGAVHLRHTYATRGTLAGWRWTWAGWREEIAARIEAEREWERIQSEIADDREALNREHAAGNF